MSGNEQQKDSKLEEEEVIDTRIQKRRRYSDFSSTSNDNSSSKRAKLTDSNPDDMVSIPIGPSVASMDISPAKSSLNAVPSPQKEDALFQCMQPTGTSSRESPTAAPLPPDLPRSFDVIPVD